VKRFVAVLAVLMLPMFGLSPAADAVGQGACTITGTITFSGGDQGQGVWKIGPATLDCQGLIAARRRIIGRGPFRGSGTFTEAVAGTGACLHHLASGTVDYRIPTSGGDILVSEPDTYTLAGGAGLFTTPTLRGPFQVAPFEGDCVSKPVTRATFVAELVLLRYPRELPTPPHGPSLGIT
jgi:hypothetical protein